MNTGVLESTTTWDVEPMGLLEPIVHEVRPSYDVRVKPPLEFLSMLMQGTTSTDVRFSLGETGDPLWDASVKTTMWSIEDLYRRPPMIRPPQVEERGPFGGRLLSLTEACQLANQIALEAERRRQEARERDALYWGDLEDEI